MEVLELILYTSHSTPTGVSWGIWGRGFVICCLRWILNRRYGRWRGFVNRRSLKSCPTSRLTCRLRVLYRCRSVNNQVHDSRSLIPHCLFQPSHFYLTTFDLCLSTLICIDDFWQNLV